MMMSLPALLYMLICTSCVERCFRLLMPAIYISCSEGRLSLPVDAVPAIYTSYSEGCLSLPVDAVPDLVPSAGKCISEVERSLIYCGAHKIPDGCNNPRHETAVFHQALLQRWKTHFAHLFPNLASSQKHAQKVGMHAWVI